MSMSIETKEVRNSKKRLSVPFSLEMYQAIENESNLLGISMSSMVAYIVGSYMVSKNAMMTSVEKILGTDLKSVEVKSK